MNGTHEMGGMQAFGPVPYEENAPVFHAPWEARTMGTTILLLGMGVLRGERSSGWPQGTNTRGSHPLSRLSE